MSNLKDIYRQQSGVVARKVVDEFILVPVSDELANMHSFFTLNSVGRYIWEQLNGTNTLQIVAEGIVKTFDVTPETAWTDLEQLIDELSDVGLVLLVTPEEAP